MPLISVVMSTYNRESIIKESIDSVLTQSFSDFEFIIIDDASTDNTKELIKSYSDVRINYFRNKVNCGCTFNYHNANNLAKGKYIAHIDDDDIFQHDKLKKQVDFLEQYTDIALVSTNIETFGERARPSWVLYNNPEEISFLMNIYNPICHSSVMFRKSFIDKHAINYDITKKFSQDYDFYKQIILNGGKISNLPEELVKYRMHANRLTDIKETQDIQINNAEIVKKELLTKYFDDNQYNEFIKLIEGFPFNEYDEDNVILALKMLLKTGFYNENIILNIINDIKNKKFVF